MALPVKFYPKEYEMTFLSEKEGRPIVEMRDFIRIEIPGMVANVVDTLVSEHHKREYPVEWARYLAQKETGAFTDYQGTPLTDWPQLNAAQATELRYYKFHTVEHIANASDQQIQSIGMVAGMHPMSLRDKAKAWLGNAQGKEAEAAAAKERDELKAELAELRKLVQDMKPKVGRPAKETA